MYLDSFNKYDCCGCGACSEICPQICISMHPDEEGFIYPIKDNNNCINCGLCEKVCPFNKDSELDAGDALDVFAAYDDANRSGSSSGGIFYSLARYVIEQRNGWVYGAAFDENKQLRHIGVNRMADIGQLRGSKYLQSRTDHVFSEIKAHLQNGDFVFFVGTPCQVSGLGKYLRKSYDSLLTADLVCHGVPSQLMFDEHVKYLEKKHNSKLVSYQFRQGDGWGGCEIAKFENLAENHVLPSYELSPYLFSFMYSYTYRKSCYNCPFASVTRVGDITLADYWGVKEFFPEIDDSKGVSLVLINSEKGRNAWSQIKDGCVYYASNIFDAVRYNGNLVHKCTEPAERETVYKRIDEEGYDKVAETLFKSPDATKVRIFNYINSHSVFRPLLALYRRLKK